MLKDAWSVWTRQLNDVWLVKKNGGIIIIKGCVKETVQTDNLKIMILKSVQIAITDVRRAEMGKKLIASSAILDFIILNTPVTIIARRGILILTKIFLYIQFVQNAMILANNV